MKRKLDETVERYLTAMAATMRPNTVDGYRTAIASLVHHLDSAHPELRSFKQLRRAPHVVGWLNFMAARRPAYSIDTRRHYIFDVRNFLERIHEWGWKEASPSGLLTTADFPRANRHLPRPLAPETDQALQQSLRQDGGLIPKSLLLARFTGIRIGELQRLEHDCVLRGQDGRYTLRVPLGKLHQDRVVPIDAATAQLVDEIRTICHDHPSIVDTDSGRRVRLLIAHPSGQPFHLDRFRIKLRQAALSAGITDRIYPHRLRHTYATDVLRYGVSLPGVMRLLGHKSLAMALRYADVTPDDLARAYLAASERSKERYAALRSPSPESGNPQTGPGTLITAALDDVIARLQQIRFDHAEAARRAALQRLVERLRRARVALIAIISDAK